jgi:beta-glucosidase
MEKIPRSQSRWKRIWLLTLVCLLPAATPVWSQQTADAAYQDTKLSFEERARDLVSRMTLEERVSQLGHTSDAVARLGIPAYNWWNEGLHGVARAGIATVFPQAIGLASTFDEDLIHSDAEAISTEFRAKYNAERGPDGSTEWYKGLTVWSPNINIFRDPRWGRGQETYGEDPFLTSRLGTAFVSGLQGDDRRYLKVVATPKHFAVHSGPESTRHEVDVTVSKHDLADTYLPAFRATIVDGKAESVMCAYNSINGEPACANGTLLDTYLRSDWKFDGLVVSDCGAGEDISEHHHFKPTMEEGVTAALKAGTDLFCELPQEQIHKERTAVLNAVHQGVLSEADVNRAVTRLLTARFRLGMFDPPAMVPWSGLRTSANDTPAHRRLALKTARESIVLLKNENHLLPLKKTYPRIAVIGPGSDSLDALEGNYNGTPAAPVTILAGIRKRFANSKIDYVQGTGLTGTAVRPVPSSALYTTMAKTVRGLKAEYFDNKDLRGEPVLRRSDANVNFTWAFNGVSPRLKKNYSVRWTGVLVPEETADYVLGFTGQDGYRVWVDDRLLVEDWTPHRPSTTTLAPVYLEKNHPYALRIEYFQTIRSAEAKLVWGIPGREEDLAEKAARRSELVVMVLGLSARIEGEEMKVKADGFSGGDRTSLDLPAPQEKLLERICAVGKPVVLVLTSGSALSVAWADEHVPAILEVWYPGESGGTALAEILAGDVSPSGRLPVTFYKSADQLPPFEDYSMSKRTYRYFDGKVLYPFGYGLGYSSFHYSNPQVSEIAASVKTAEKISVDVANTGRTPADEVIQLYLTHQGVPGTPIRELKGFGRVHLLPGEKRPVEFTLTERELSSVDQNGQRRVVPGDVTVWIGGGQPITSPTLAKTNGVATSFKITNSAVLPD